MGEITFQVNEPLTVEEFIEVLEASTLAERRPTQDRSSLEDMLLYGNLTVTARAEGKLVGIARSLTDFSFIAYLSDLAVDCDFQRRGIGRELIRKTREQLGPRCKILLLSAPRAIEYYPHLGFEHHPQAWILPPDRQLD